MTWIKPDKITGIGSVPFQEAEDGLKLVAENVPYWPHWPQLPANNAEGGMVFQYIQPLVKLGLIKGEKNPVFTSGEAQWNENLTRFYELYLAFQEGEKEAEDFFNLQGQSFKGLNAFLDSFEQFFPKAEGVKGQITGPLSIGLEIKDQQGKDSFYDKTLQDLLVKCLETQGIMQVRKLQTTKKPVVIFIDDPAIFLLGTASHITLTEKEIATALKEIILPLKKLGAKVGVHVCAQTNWSLLFNLPLDVVSFDAYNYFPSMMAQVRGLESFLQRGGKMAWGIVPTSEIAWEVSVDKLKGMFEQQCAELARLGLDIQLLKSNIIWTPSCGTGTLPPELAEHIYQLLKSFAESR